MGKGNECFYLVYGKKSLHQISFEGIPGMWQCHSSQSNTKGFILNYVVSLFLLWSNCMF